MNNFNIKQNYKNSLHSLPNCNKKLRVGIIGAGISGLVAGFELKKKGHFVKLFEANNRIGGRIYTHKFDSDCKAELGAMRIPDEHDATLHYVEELGLKKRKFVNHNGNAFYYVKGLKTRINAWQNIANIFDLSPHEQGIEPNQLLRNFMNHAYMQIGQKQQSELYSSAKISTDIVKQYEFHSFLQEAVNSKSIDSFSQSAFDFVTAISGLSQYQHASFLEVLIDYFGLFNNEQWELEQGMESLTQALAEQVGYENIFINHKVSKIRINRTENEVMLHFNDTKNISSLCESFDFIICTAPAPATSTIEFSPKLSPQKSNALRKVSYASSSKTVFLVKERIWELNDGIAGGGSFTDELMQQCWYPSDNGIKDIEAKSYKPRNLSLSRSKSVLTASYTWGSNARHIASLKDDQKLEVILKTLEKIHPGIGKSILDVKHHSWDVEEGLGGGAFAYFAPGDHSRYMDLMQSSYPNEEPKVFFAGEHLDVVHAWIQGAIQSSIKAIHQLLSEQLKKEL